MPGQATTSSFLSTSRGKVTLALLCLAGFLDVIDTTIVNVALPSIKGPLHFSVQRPDRTNPDRDDSPAG